MKYALHVASFNEDPILIDCETKEQADKLLEQFHSFLPKEQTTEIIYDPTYPDYFIFYDENGNINTIYSVEESDE